MKEKLNVFFNKVKTALKKVDVFDKVIEWAKINRLVMAGIFFILITLAVILVAILVRNEFVVPVCVLVILEVLMAVLLYRTELWIHGILLLAQLVVGEFIDRLPLTLLCIVVYIAAIASLHFGIKKENHE